MENNEQKDTQKTQKQGKKPFYKKRFPKKKTSPNDPSHKGSDSSAVSESAENKEKINSAGRAENHSSKRRRKRSPKHRGASESAVAKMQTAKESDTVSVPPVETDTLVSEDTLQNNENGSTEASVEVIGVRFRNNGKIYYFDPCGLTVPKCEPVIVETARGIEFGYTVLTNRTVSESAVVLPLRRVLRIADQADKERFTANKAKEREAFKTCSEKIEEHKIPMHLVDVEYTFDNSKLLFYFTAEGRVDFRDLVKDLASVFHTRIELRQIGIRDEAKIIGGLGICGRPLCCKSFLYDFSQVSIKMAKEQNLSLNSSKISGTCGRLMCCLKYEHETYEEEIAKTPRLDSIVVTPEGEGVVIETLPLTGMVKVKLRDEQKQPKLFHRDTLTVIGHTRPRKNNANSDISEADLKILESE